MNEGIHAEELRTRGNAYLETFFMFLSRLLWFTKKFWPDKRVLALIE